MNFRYKIRPPKPTAALKMRQKRFYFQDFLRGEHSAKNCKQIKLGWFVKISLTNE